MAAIKPNKYPTIYEFNYKPRNYESQEIYFKKLQKRENLLKRKGVKESTFLQPTTAKVQQSLNWESNCLWQRNKQESIKVLDWMKTGSWRQSNNVDTVLCFLHVTERG